MKWLSIVMLLLAAGCGESGQDEEALKETVIGDELELKQEVEQLEEKLQEEVDQLQDKIDEQVGG